MAETGNTLAAKRIRVRLRGAVGALVAAVVAVQGSAAGVEVAPPAAQAPGSRVMTELTAEQRREAEAMLREARLIAEATAREALQDPGFVAAVRELQARATAAGGGYDQNAVAAPLQLTSGLLFYYGQTQIRKAIFEHFGVDFSFFPPKMHRIKPNQKKDYNPAKRLVVGAAAIGVSTAIAYFSPPVVVEGGFRDKSYVERLQLVTSLDFTPPSPRLIQTDVDDPLDPGSCFATLGLRADDSGLVTDFGEFAERDLVWTHPFGSFPNLTELLPEILNAIQAVLERAFSGVSFDAGDIGGIVNELAEFGEYDLDDPVGDFIDDLMHSWLNLEDGFYDYFTGWKLIGDGITCSGGTCMGRDGPSLARFNGQLDTLPGILRYDFSYRQSLLVKEYFEPTFTGLQEHLTVYYEALAPGGVPTDLPPVGYDGSPAPGHSQVLDPTWFGLTDNCDPRPVLEWSIPDFLELGVHQLPVAATDRSGNRAGTTITVVVQDSIPPDVLPPEDVGITAPAGAATVPFTGTDAAGDPIGCLTWLCEGNPPQYQLHPPLSFDFASLEPDIQCTVSNSLYASPEPCAGADLAVGEDNTVTWTLTDPSGNATTVDQLAVVREAGSNRAPSVAGGAFTIPSDVTVEIPLSASDPDLDPLTFRISALPQHGDLDAEAEAIFQTRFATSGTVRRATSFARIAGTTGNPSGVLAVGDGPSHTLLVFDVIGDPYLYNLVDLGDVAPDAIQVYDGPRDIFNVGSVDSGLGHLWIADFTDEGGGDPVVNALYRLEHHGGTNYTVEYVADLPLPPGTHGRDFRIEAFDFQGQDQSADVTVFVTGDPPLLFGSPPTYNPDNQRLGFHIASTDYGATWTVTVTDPGTPASATSTTFDPENGCGSGSTTTVEAFWSTSPPWGQLRFDAASYELTAFLQDPDGPGPALPVLQDPTAVGLSGSCNDFLVLEAQDLKLERFSRNGGGLDRELNASWPLRLTSFITIRGIEEIPASGPGQPEFYVLDDEGLYRFDLAGRLRAFVSFISAGAVNTLPPANGTQWWDIATDPAGHVFMLRNVTSGGTTGTPGAIRLDVAPGVGNVSDNGRAPTFGNNQDTAWAITADDAAVFVTGTDGLYRCTNDLSSCSRLQAASPYRDLELRTGTGEIFASEINGATQRVVRLDRTTGAVVATFGQGRLDFNAGGAAAGDDLSAVMYGRLAYDAGSDRLYVSDNPVDPGTGQRIPRVVVFSGDGTWLEDIVPDASPNLFGTWLQPGDFGSVSDIAVGPGRTYVAEDAPLKRLHVFDVATFFRVPCPDPTVECRTVTYIPDPGYAGPDGFDYAAVDPFGAQSADGHIALDIVTDTTPPSLACPADLAVEARDPGGVTLTDPIEHEPDAALRDFFSRTATDDVDLPDPVVTRDGGQSFPVGSTVVTFTATDGAGNQASCQATLTVTDTTPPQFLGSGGNVVQELDPVVVEATAPQTPFSPPPPAVRDVGGLASLAHDGPAAYPVGDTPITWTATDLAGNVATATQTVRVQDTTPPEFILPLPPDDTFVQTPAVSGWANPLEHEPQKATDAVGVEDLSCEPALADPVPVGLITVTCVAYDAAGNVGRRSFFVDVQDADPDGDGIGNLVDTEPTTPSADFSDAAHGGITSGSVLGGDHPLLVTDGPAERLGVSVVVAGRDGPRPTQVSLCDGGLTAQLAYTEVFIEPDLVVPDPETEVNDALIATCLRDGFEATSEHGSVALAFRLPHGGAVVKGTVDTGETARLEGWGFEVPAGSAGPVTLGLPDGREVTVRPGLALDLMELVMGPSADLGLTAAAGPSPAVPGGPVTVTFDVAGRGPSAAREAVLAIGLPPGLVDPVTTGCAEDPSGVPACTIGEVPPGATARVTLAARISERPTLPLVVTGAVSAQTFDPEPGNDTASVELRVGATKPPEAVASFRPAEIPLLGGAAELEITLAAPGDTAASLGQVSVEAELPAGLLVAAPAGAASSCGGSLTAIPGTTRVSLTGAALAAGEHCTVTVRVTVDPDRAVVGDHAASVVPAAAETGPGSAAEAVVTLTPVRSFTGPTATGTGEAAVRFTGGGDTCSFARAAWVATSAAGPGEMWFPHGLLAFATTGCAPGEALQLELELPAPLDGEAAFWSWGPSASDPSPHWHRLPSTTSAGTVRVTIADGGDGDGDLAADGAVHALGGAAAAQQVERIPVTGPFGTALLVLLLALAGWVLLLRRTLP